MAFVKKNQYINDEEKPFWERQKELLKKIRGEEQ